MDQTASTKSQLAPMISNLGLFRNSFLFIKENFKKLFYIILIAHIPYLAKSLIKIFLSYSLANGTIISDDSLTGIFHFSLIIYYASPILTLLGAIFYLLGMLALLVFIVNNELTVTEAYKKSLEKIFSYLWITFLNFLIIIAGLILFVIPGIFLAVSYSLATYLLVDKNLKGYSALKESKKLIKNHWWPVFGRYASLFLFFLILALPFFLESLTGSYIIFSINLGYKIIYSFLSSALPVIFSFYIYKDLKK